MSRNGDQRRFHLGFLWIAETDAGFCGGLLVTNHLGRPLEFQCTTPVRPNRTQEILYGTTLKAFLYSELLGKTLVERLKVQPDLIVVAQSELLALRQHVDVAVATLVEFSDDKRELADQILAQLGGQQLRFHPEFEIDRDLVHDRGRLIADDSDLCEPINRVKDALLETVRGGNAA